MENLYFVKEQLAKGIYAAALPPTRALAQVAVADIGAVAVRVLEDAGRFTGKRLDLASDQLPWKDALAILCRVTGPPFTYYQVQLDVILQRVGDDAARMYESFARVGFTVERRVSIKGPAVIQLDLVAACGTARQILPIDLPWIPGHEFSGIVEQIGSDVAACAPGDAVCGPTTGMGAYAEYLAVKTAAVARKTSNFSFGEAASVPVASQNA